MLWVMDHRQSDNIYLSWNCLLTISLTINLRPGSISWNFGIGVPLHTLDKHHNPFYILFYVVECSIAWTRLSIPPNWMIVFRLSIVSHEIFPKAQKLCSTIPRYLEFNKSRNKGMHPFCTIHSHCFLDPDAMLVSAQVASNWSWGYSDRLMY